jgi:hypothetical protein
MTPAMLLLLVASPVATWLFSAVLNHAFRAAGASFSPQRACFWAGGLTWVALLACRFGLEAAGAERPATWAGTLGDVAYLSVFAFCINFLNWFVYALTETSMHIHLMVEIGRAPGSTRGEIVGRYNKQTIVRARVARLLGLRQLAERDGRFFTTGRWILLSAEACRRLRILLGIPPRPPFPETP